MKRKSLLALVVFLSLSSTGLTPVPANYLERLKAMRGYSYFKFNCVQFIEEAAKTQLQCRAADLWDGCKDQAVVVAQLQSLASLRSYSLQPGDVICFHGVHAAVYLGGWDFMDSDFLHDGVGTMKPTNGPWFRGPVRILRWKTQYVSYQSRS